MRNALPGMPAALALRKPRVPRADDGRKKPRLQRLYRLASGRAQSRHEGARVLGGQRHPSGHWRASDEAGAWRRCEPCPGPPVRRSRSPRRSSRRLSGAAGRRRGLPPTKRCAKGSSRPLTWRSTITRATRLAVSGARLSLRSRAPVPPKTPAALQALQATCQAQVQRVMPPENTRPGRVFSRADSRVGWLTVRRRRLTAGGVQPVGALPHGFAWCSVDGAIAPTTGARFVLERPYVTAKTCPLVVAACAAAFPDRLHVLRWEHSGAHTAQHMRWPAHGRCVWRPPSGPERNPMARFWRDLQDDLAWLQCTERDAQQVYVGALLQAYEASTLQTLTGDPYVVEAIHALSS